MSKKRQAIYVKCRTVVKHFRCHTVDIEFETLIEVLMCKGLSRNIGLSRASVEKLRLSNERAFYRQRRSFHLLPFTSPFSFTFIAYSDFRKFTCCWFLITGLITHVWGIRACRGRELSEAGRYTTRQQFCEHHSKELARFVVNRFASNSGQLKKFCSYR